MNALASTRRRVLLHLALLCLLMLFHAHPAHAYSCSAASPGTQSFGNVNPVSGNAYAVTGTIAVSCTVSPLESLISGTMIRVCLGIGGASGSSPRQLNNGSYNLNYNLYSDAAHTQIVGTAGATPGPIVIDFNLTLLGILLGGTGTYNVSLYGYLPAGQTTVPAGTYNASFSGSNAAVNYLAYVGSAPTCSAAWNSGGSFAFNVAATVTNNCNIAASNVTFPAAGLLSSAIAANGTLTVQCTMSDSYSIALNGGTSTGGTVANRQMALSGGSALVAYQLYSNSSLSTIWGDGTSGSSIVGGVGSGSTQSYSVYGQVPAQSTPIPGSYTDTITATVTY